MIGTGIDFGTSNSAAAWYDGKRVTLVTLEDPEAIMPTATHLDRQLRPRTGVAAVNQYIEENRDRIVELTPEVIGKGALLVNEGNPDDPHTEAEVMTSNVYGAAVVDRGLPGRLFRGIKRLLANPSIKRLMVFDHPFRLVALITPVLLHMRKCIEEQVPEALGDVHVGHPVRFEGQSEADNELALARLGEACNYAGFKNLTFFPEPVAATLSFLHDEDAPDQGRVLALDFGGGTLDLSVVEFCGMDFKVLSTSGLSLGGDHIDQLIFRELLFPLLGKGETWSRVKDGRLIENEFPFDEFEDKLLNWAVTYTLNQNHYRSKVADCIKKGGPAAEKFARLDDLITHNYSYIVFQAIKEAKAKLSWEEETILDIPELDISLEFRRAELEEMMSDMLSDIDRIVDDVVRKAGLESVDIDMVIRTGGSSLIAAVRRMLDTKFPGKVTEHDPFTSVAAGLAIASWYGFEFSEEQVLT
ncbi:MAG: Hsp70 family protein [Pseudomonadales bacterium]|nr:Hsp70 family protein [Pseudomonadales bacterium]